MNAAQACELKELGNMRYKEAWDLQLQLFNERTEGRLQGKSLPHCLLFVEHPHVYTFGKSAEENHMLATPAMLQSMGADVHHIERGGDITYHGPGQLVVYPIFDLQQLGIGVKAYVEGVEKAIIETLKHFDIASDIIPEQIGVWLGKGGTNERKIAAIGIKCSRYITMHGLALNVNTDLRMFGHIVPCGIPDKAVTSMQHEKNSQIDINTVKNILGKQFAIIFGLEYTL